jgi:Ca-activated chloride channel family protein
MNFAHPKMLWLLALTVPLLSLFFWWSWRKRQFLVSQFVQSRLLAHLTVGLSKGVQKSRMILLVLGVALLLLALAEPRWGFAWEEARQRGLDIVVAIDTSRSMLAEDIPPNRLQRAKLAALDLMRLAKRDRLGLVAFAGTAFLQCPLTLDDEAFRQSLDQLDVGIIPQGGTALAEAIQTAQTAFKEEGDNHRILILFTDGEDHDSGALDAATKAAEAGLRIFTVGVGTPNGELLRQRDEQGNSAYIKDADGNVVKSRLNEALLTSIAKAANGFYLPLSSAKSIDVLYERGLAPLPKSEVSSKLVRQYHERYQWPLAAAILILILEVFLPDRKRVQRSETITSASNPELRKLVAILALALIGCQAWASPSSAMREYQSGQFKDAEQEYLRLLQRKPDDVRLRYNAGTAAYQAKNFDEAVKHFSSAVTAPDLQLQEHAYYNLGNSLFRLGDAEQAVDKKTQAWEQSAQDFEAALKLDPKDSDAKFNLDFVKKKLEELKKQQQQQKDQNQKPNQDQNKDDSKDSQSQDQKQQDQQKKDQEKKDQEKKDQEKQQQQQADKSKDSQSKTNRQDEPKSSPQDKSSEEQKKKEENQKQQRQKKDQGDQSETAQSQNQSKDNPQTNGAPANASAILGQMTPAQAQQLLDAQKDNEKAMIFIPPEKANSGKRVFKDW